MSISDNLSNIASQHSSSSSSDWDMLDNAARNYDVESNHMNAFELNDDDNTSCSSIEVLASMDSINSTADDLAINGCSLVSSNKILPQAPSQCSNSERSSHVTVASTEQRLLCALQSLEQSGHVENNSHNNERHLHDVPLFEEERPMYFQQAAAANLPARLQMIRSNFDEENESLPESDLSLLENSGPPLDGVGGWMAVDNEHQRRVRQYLHRPNERINGSLSILCLVALSAGLGLGVGHFIGSTKERHYQRAAAADQTERLRSLQDDLVQCVQRYDDLEIRVQDLKANLVQKEYVDKWESLYQEAEEEKLAIQEALNLYRTRYQRERIRLEKLQSDFRQLLEDQQKLVNATERGKMKCDSSVGLSPSTLRRRISSLRLLLTSCQRERLSATNVTWSTMSSAENGSLFHRSSNNDSADSWFHFAKHIEMASRLVNHIGASASNLSTQYLSHNKTKALTASLLNIWSTALRSHVPNELLQRMAMSLGLKKKNCSSKVVTSSEGGDDKVANVSEPTALSQVLEAEAAKYNETNSQSDSQNNTRWYQQRADSRRRHSKKSSRHFEHSDKWQERRAKLRRKVHKRNKFIDESDSDKRKKCSKNVGGGLRWPAWRKQVRDVDDEHWAQFFETARLAMRSQLDYFTREIQRLHMQVARYGRNRFKVLRENVDSICT